MGTPLFNLLFTALLLFGATLPALKAQKNYYDGSISGRNFRQNPLFQQKIGDKVDYRRLNACLFFATNEQRLKNGLTEVPHLLSMEIAAWHHSRNMVEKGFFSHYNPVEKERKSPTDRARLAGLKNPSPAENIAYYGLGGTHHTMTETYLEVALNLVQQWMDSRGHRENILSKQNLYMGMAVYIDIKPYLDSDNRPTNGFYVKFYGTQMFQWFHQPEEDFTTATDKLSAFDGQRPIIVQKIEQVAVSEEKIQNHTTKIATKDDKTVVSLYSLPNYRGEKSVIAVGKHYLSNLSIGRSLASAQIPTGYRLIAFHDEACQTPIFSLQGDTEFVGWKNFHKAAAIIIEPLKK
ncbi:CAP domain-containing protein [Hugenholtzia roseola]|uniref:CAP domain-containing protein n=1 Tax=Hugenholtzia roseola TaxID=1002 RepID=UPI00041428D4|nr:CAP domain-containing protein [Hugenholtzia roseola]